MKSPHERRQVVVLVDACNAVRARVHRDMACTGRVVAGHMSDLPFDDLEGEPAPAVPQRLTAIQYAVQQNSDEDWEVCCVCGVGEDAAPYGKGLARGLVLLDDGTLARSAWCMALVCSGDKYAAIWLPIDSKEIQR